MTETKPASPKSDTGKNEKARERAVAEFQSLSQAERLQRPEYKSAAKALAYANGHIDAAYGRNSDKAKAAREMMKGHIANLVASGRSVNTPKTVQARNQEQNRVTEQEKSQDRSR